MFGGNGVGVFHRVNLRQLGHLHEETLRKSGNGHN
jgi:hypothetical protein